MAVTMVLGKLSEEGGPFPGHLACLRKELKFSALNYFWLRCSSKGERDRPWKSVASVEITNEESAGGGGGEWVSRAPRETPIQAMGGGRGDQTTLQRYAAESQSGRKENKRPKERKSRKVGDKGGESLRKGARKQARTV